MNVFLPFTILIVGAGGIVAQVLILRELLVSFYGNELIVGIILGNWILGEALGAFLIGKIVSSRSSAAPVVLFLLLQLLFSSAFILSLYAARVFKAFLGIPFAEAVGLTPVFLISLAVNFPVAFSHGGLFSCLCRMQAPGDRAIGKTYVWETKGTMLGGLAVTWFFIPRFTSFQTAVFFALLNMAVCLFFLRYAGIRIHKITAAGAVLLFSFALVLIGPGRLHDSSLRSQWKGMRVLDYRNSVYGNIVVTGQELQYTFYYNGLPFITVPYPDTVFSGEFGTIPLLFSDSPADILVIGGGAGGTVEQILRHPVRRVEYVQLDPQVTGMLKKFPTSVTQRELQDARVCIINTDGRFFVRNTSRRYDVILVLYPQPSDLAVNRVFTREFFSEAKQKLTKNGVLAFCLPGSSTYMGKELRDVNVSVYRAAENVFGFVRVIPGEVNMYLASENPDIRVQDAACLAGRLRQRNIETVLLTQDYLGARLDRRKEEWFIRLSAGSSVLPNRDSRPRAVYHMMLFWNKQFSDPLIRALPFFTNTGMQSAGIAVFLLFAAGGCWVLCRKGARGINFALIYSILTTGFFSMLVNLMLIFIFQSAHGYLYYKIGLLISFFMAGIAAGGMLVPSMVKRFKTDPRFFIAVEILIIVFTAFFAVAADMWLQNSGQWVFTCLFFIPGFLTGLAFPLAGGLYRERGAGGPGRTAGILCGADLLGGWFAGMIGGVIVLPLVGFAGACLIIILLKMSSFLFLICLGKNFKKNI
ncbi:MAG: fused MFS/spermidine synthase [Candidatus Omnitrophica bacterium]|nr:fused MFS/spermidine synthase [Candidatus Omnitrophota bacterium]